MFNLFLRPEDCLNPFHSHICWIEGKKEQCIRNTGFQRQISEWQIQGSQCLPTQFMLSLGAQRNTEILIHFLHADPSGPEGAILVLYIKWRALVSALFMYYFSLAK